MADTGRRAACDRVYGSFPELDGVRPSVQRAGPNRVFTFQKEHPAGGGAGVLQTVRVTVDPEGRVVKVAVSR